MSEQVKDLSLDVPLITEAKNVRHPQRQTVLS